MTFVALDSKGVNGVPRIQQLIIVEVQYGTSCSQFRGSFSLACQFQMDEENNNTYAVRCGRMKDCGRNAETYKSIFMANNIYMNHSLDGVTGDR